MADLLDEKPHHSWRESARAILHPKVIAMLFLGFSAGVPILLIFSTLSVWLREAGVGRSAITFFSWAALGYSFKFVWAPLIDRLPVPVLAGVMGRRRSWLLVAQLLIMAAMAFMALSNPTENLFALALGAVMLGFASATQDIVIDAYRIESATEDLLNLMSAAYVAGYRIGMVVAGAGALELAGVLDVVEGYDYAVWRTTYLAMAGVMLVGVVTTFIVREPDVEHRVIERLQTLEDYLRFVALFLISAAGFVAVFYFTSDYFMTHAGLTGEGLADRAKTVLAETLGILSGWAGFWVEGARLIAAFAVALGIGRTLVKVGLVPASVARETYIDPFADFFRRYGKVALYVILLVATYRISDIVMGVVANVFYVDIGFEKQEIGRISKFFGVIMTIFGGFLGGLLAVRYGVMRILFLGGVLAAASNVLFAAMAAFPDAMWAAGVWIEPLFNVLILAPVNAVIWVINLFGADLAMGENFGGRLSTLALVIVADNISGGLATTAFVAYLSTLTSTKFTATQFALFSSMMTLFPKLIAGYSGMMVDGVGYGVFFLGTAVIGVIPLALIIQVARMRRA